MSVGLKPYQFRGNNINDGAIYSSFLLLEEGFAFNTSSAQTVETERPYGFPLFVRSQPDGERFVLEVRNLVQSQANLDQLKKWFSPFDDPGYLVVDDNFGESPTVRRRILCAVERLIASEVNIFKAVLRASTAIWEAENATSPVTNTITTSGQTFNVSNIGSARSLPKLTLKPKILLSNTNSWVKRRHIVIANRSEQPLYDYLGEGYPILICDLSTLSPAITPSSAVRVVLNGVDQIRYLSGNKLWTHLQFRPRKLFTLADDLTSGFTGEITASNAEGFVGWPHSGFALIDNECVQYNDATDTTINIITSGALDTTAATHSTGATGYWVEHPNLYLMYDYSVAPLAQEPVDRQPVINLASSSNNAWVWPGPFFSANDRRSATWRREYIEQNPASQFIRSYEDSGRIVFENASPIAGRVLANNVIMEAPCALSMAAASVQASVSTFGSVPIPVEGYGFRKRTVRRTFTYAQIGINIIETLEYGTQSKSTGEWITLNTITYTKKQLVQESVTEEILEDIFVTDRGAESEQSLYQGVWTGNYVVVISSQTASVINYVLRQEEQAVPLQVTTITYEQEKGTTEELSSMAFTAFAVDREGYEGSLQLNAIAAVPIFRVRFNAMIPVGVDLNGDPFSEAPESVQDGTGAQTRIDDITINFDQNRTPKIVIGTNVQNLYLLNGQLKNDTTGDFVDFSFLMLIDQQLELDCENHTIKDLTTGLEVPFAIAASNPRDWFYLTPGTNTFSFTMPGIGSGQGNIEIIESHRTRWL